MSKDARKALANPTTTSEKMKKAEYTRIHGKNLECGKWRADCIKTVGTSQPVCHAFVGEENMIAYFIRESAWLKDALHDFRGEDSGLRYRMIYTVKALDGRVAEMLSEVTTMHLSTVISFDEKTGIARCITCKHNHFHKLSKMYYDELTSTGENYKHNLQVLSLAIIRYDLNDKNTKDVTEEVLKAKDTTHALQLDRANASKAYSYALLTERKHGARKTTIKFNDYTHKAEKKVGKKYAK